MTIYFDENKKAYNTRPEICICEIDDVIWAFYSQYPDTWDIIDGVFTDIRDTEEYKQKELLKAKQVKVAEIKKANHDFYAEEGHTIQIDLPCVLQKGEETKQVANFKLLTLTSAGQLTTVLMGYAMLANSMDIQDLLNDNEGWTVTGLNNVVSGTKFINLIFAKASEKIGLITMYQRYLELLVAQAENMEDLYKIIVDFDNPVIPENVNLDEEEPVK